MLVLPCRETAAPKDDGVPDKESLGKRDCADGIATARFSYPHGAAAFGRLASGVPCGNGFFERLEDSVEVGNSEDAFHFVGFFLVWFSADEMHNIH